jgi:hypothetical protein
MSSYDNNPNANGIVISNQVAAGAAEIAKLHIEKQAEIQMLALNTLCSTINGAVAAVLAEIERQRRENREFEERQEARSAAQANAAEVEKIKSQISVILQENREFARTLRGMADQASKE